MKIIRRQAVKYLTNLKVIPKRMRKEGQTSFTCPLCSTKRNLNWRTFARAHAALNDKSPFADELRMAFDAESPLQKIETNVLGRKMPLYLEYALDFNCSRCGAPARIVFALVESEDSEPFYMIKSLLSPQKGYTDSTFGD